MTTMNKSIRTGLLAGVAVAAVTAAMPTDANAVVYGLAWQKILNLTVTGLPAGAALAAQASDYTNAAQITQSGGIVVDKAGTGDAAGGDFSEDRSINMSTDPCGVTTGGTGSTGPGPIDGCRAVATFAGGSASTTENLFNVGANAFTTNAGDDNTPNFQGIDPTTEPEVVALGAFGSAARNLIAGPGKSTYGYADNIMTDSIIDADNPDPTSVGATSTDAGFGGDLEAIVEGAVAGAELGVSNQTNSALSRTWQFSASSTTTVTLTIEFDLFLRSRAWVSEAESKPPAKAEAVNDISISLQPASSNTATSFSVTGGVVAQTASNDGGDIRNVDEEDLSLLDGNIGVGGLGGITLSASTAEPGARHIKFELIRVVKAGESATLALTSTLNVSLLSSVPEPATLGLMGAGLLGLGALTRRRKRRKAG